MKRYFFAFVLAFFLALYVSPASGGEVLDAVIATVNHKPLFKTDWDESTCFEAFMQQKPLAQLTETDRVTALQRMVDRQLLEAQMGDTAYLQPSVEELQKDVVKLRSQIPGTSDEQSWQRLLRSYRLTEDVVKQHLADEKKVMNFVEVRLRPNVRVQPDDVEAYYRHQVLPDLRKSGRTFSLDELEPKIRELLTQQRMDELLDAWLHNLRQQSEIQSSVPLPELHAPGGADRASGVN